MKQELMNFFLFIGLSLFLYILFKNLNFSTTEGMKNASENEDTISNGIAGNAASYSATLKKETIKLQDTFLISKYRSDYETIILNLDDLINNLMLKTVLTLNSNNPSDSIQKLAEMNQAKIALNNTLKFLDENK